MFYYYHWILLFFFQKFKKCKLHGKNFEVQAVDDLTIDGILIVYLKESYVEAPMNDPIPPSPDPEINPNDAYVLGDFLVYPFDIKTYTFGNLAGGKWEISNNRAKITAQNNSSFTVEVTTGKSGEFSLVYRLGDAVYFSKDIKILSL